MFGIPAEEKPKKKKPKERKKEKKKKRWKMQTNLKKNNQGLLTGVCHDLIGPVFVSKLGRVCFPGFLHGN